MVNLLDSIIINGLKLKNRLVMPPIGTDLATNKGEVTEKHLSSYKPRARGMGLVIVEHSYVDFGGRYTATQIGIHNDNLIPRLKKLVEVIHGSGTAAAIQINHSGGKCVESVCGMQPVGPSSIKYWKEPTRGLDISEINELVKKFGNSATRAVVAGFDAVEIHAAHGWLLNEFTSPLTNKRTDQYGGSLENRFRFALEVIREVRSRVGDNFPVLFRLGADDFTPGGLTTAESKKIAPIIVEEGIDVMDISSGICGIYHPTNRKPGFFVPMAEEIKKVISIPVIGVGGITTVDLANSFVSEKKVDLVAIGRALMKDPEWGVKAMRALKNKSINESS
jgi:2,4-dienoyl-CoA reductase-like NADH-dependent reductase (Old Yellow Enzyme family)